jgi:flavin reductase (DIM6/NTAB) family NADH-FMN oxidoreductase RutF
MVETISSDDFREALSRFASGVTVVTVEDREGPVGFTATGFTSVSLLPPLVLVCLAKDASVYEAIVGASSFGVSILDATQTSLARRFAQSDIDRFDSVALRYGEVAHVPLIEGALAHLECRRHALQDVGDHTLVVGAVVAASAGTGWPLVHFARRFGGFVTERPDQAPAPSP